MTSSVLKSIPSQILGTSSTHPSIHPNVTQTHWIDDQLRSNSKDRESRYRIQSGYLKNKNIERLSFLICLAWLSRRYFWIYLLRFSNLSTGWGRPWGNRAADARTDILVPSSTRIFGSFAKNFVLYDLHIHTVQERKTISLDTNFVHQNPIAPRDGRIFFSKFVVKIIKIWCASRARVNLPHIANRLKLSNFYLSCDAQSNFWTVRRSFSGNSYGRYP
jgi:hypothetical protein